MILEEVEEKKQHEREEMTILIVPHRVNEPLRKNQSRARAVSSQLNTGKHNLVLPLYRPAYRHRFIAETGLMFESMQMRL
jgi:hypothetical protein